MKKKYKPHTLAKPILMVSTMVPPIGFVVFLYLRKTAPKKAKQALRSAFIGVPIAIIMSKYIIPQILGLAP